jgi:hypothetical protein
MAKNGMEVWSDGARGRLGCLALSMLVGTVALIVYPAVPRQPPWLRKANEDRQVADALTVSGRGVLILAGNYTDSVAKIKVRASPELMARLTSAGILGHFLDVDASAANSILGGGGPPAPCALAGDVVEEYLPGRSMRRSSAGPDGSHLEKMTIYYCRSQGYGIAEAFFR